MKYIRKSCDIHYLSSLFICIGSSGIGNNVSKTNKRYILHDMAYLQHVRILFTYTLLISSP